MIDPAPSDPGHAAAPPAPTTADATARLEVWKRSLLDLSLRNRLLDIRDSKQVISFTRQDAASLVAALYDEATFDVIAAPGPEAMAAHAFPAALTDEEITKRLTTMARVARSNRDEGGVHVLWLAIGSLVWRERDEATWRRAPILLVPVALERRAVGERYRVVPRADEPRLNLTLLEKLRAEWGLVLDVPSANEAGEFDATAVLAAVAKAIAGQVEWRVQNDATLGIFSFAKFVMWTDLQERAAAVVQAPVAMHILSGGKTSILPQVAFVRPEALDALPIAQTLTPLDADSTQLSAVLAAGQGASFVLQGPPGTGKSQTITNLVAHAMAQGKRVLFVSEKMAALEVVKKRLTQAGLGDFCLELHSNKAQKRDVIGDLGRVLERAWRPAGQAEGDDATLARLRDELGAYADAVHQPMGLGMTFYDAVAKVAALTPAAVAGSGLVPQPGDTASPDAFAAAEAMVKQYGEALALVAPVDSHPWRDSSLASWQPSRAARLEAALGALAASHATFAELDGLARASVPGIRATTSNDLAALSALATLAAQAPSMRLELLLELGTAPAAGEAATATAALAPTTTVAARPANPADYVALANRAHVGQEALAAQYDEGLWALDVRQLKEAFATYAPRNWLVRWFGLRGPKRQLTKVAKRALGPNDAVLRDLEVAHDVVRARRTLGDATPDATRWFGAATLSAGQLGQVAGHVAWGHQMQAAFAALEVLPNVDRQGSWRALCASIVSERNTWQRVAALAASAKEALADFEAASGVSLARETDDLGAVLASRLPGWQANTAALRDWTAYRHVRDSITNSGNEALVACCEREPELVGAALVATWQRATLLLAAEAHMQSKPALAQFHGHAHHAKVTEFAGYDQASLAVVRARMIANIAERVPRLGAGVADDGEVGILLRELKKQRRHKALRTLFREIPTLLGRLKPCMLMSPLSVAQYLDPSAPKFDLVVFDEASQIPASDAVGALARGMAAVVVGDSKQLPPTRFFSDLSAGDETSPAVDDGFEELESVLDECVAANLPQLYLGWHYRSRHESLIEFSNRAYYDERLQVFPAAASTAPNLGVRLVSVPGTYDRAATRTNRVEAQAVVAAVVAHLTGADTQHKSLAVVTFSQAQQHLIEDLLDEARARQPALDAYFADAAAEPVIVKNLETIQGDERDVVMFSIGYGPDANGALAMNFGPLNREGGERRLNVAISRAREQLVVYASLDPLAMRLEGAGRGVTDLAAFLRFAQARTANDAPPAAPANAIVAAIGEGLVERGYQVRYAVGCSAYRIDVAVVDPDDPTRLIFGIETDGPAYRLAASARDRDRLRASVLGGMGWRLARVWSADWIADAGRELTRLHTALVNAIAAARASKKAKGAPPVAVALAPASPTPTPVIAAVPVPVPVPVPAPASALPTATPTAAAPAAYRPASLRKQKREPTWIYSGESSFELMALMTSVIEAEAPVHLNVMVQRVSEALGMPRATSKLTERVRGLVAGVGQFGPGDDDFIWPKSADASVLVLPPRPPATSDADQRRAVEEISLAELAGAAKELLAVNLGMERAALAKEMAKFFGYPRPSDRMMSRLDMGVAQALAAGVAQHDGSRIVSA